jgi:hypothetical protein
MLDKQQEEEETDRDYLVLGAYQLVIEGDYLEPSAWIYFELNSL